MAKLITERDVEQAAKAGMRRLDLPVGAVLTPAARDRARTLGVDLGEPVSAPRNGNGHANGAAWNGAPRADSPSRRPQLEAPRFTGSRGNGAGPATAANAVTGRPTTGEPVVESTAVELTVQVKERRSQRAMLDFVAGLKGYHHVKDNARIYAERETQFKKEHGRPPTTVAEALALISDQLTFRTDYFIHKVSQDILWRSVGEIVKPHAADLKARLKAAETQGPGKLELDPSIKLPTYFSSTEFHMMPGSYFDEELGGFFFDIGGSIYFSNQYDGARMQRAVLESLPEGVNPKRVLDVGCSTGTATILWKQAYPQAEVIGIDLGAPMLRYAHLKAVEQGVDVTFSQRAAEYTGYPDNSFDVVTATILTHELPASAIRQFFREAHRILKPGGHLLNGDINPIRTNPSSMGMLRPDWEREQNGEPYMVESLTTNYVDVAREVGFREVTEPGKVHAATGQTFPWITLARK